MQSFPRPDVPDIWISSLHCGPACLAVRRAGDSPPLSGSHPFLARAQGVIDEEEFHQAIPAHVRAKHSPEEVRPQTRASDLPSRCFCSRLMVPGLLARPPDLFVVPNA